MCLRLSTQIECLLYCFSGTRVDMLLLMHCGLIHSNLTLWMEAQHAIMY